MKKYEVTVSLSGFETYLVEAESEAEAEEKINTIDQEPIRQDQSWQVELVTEVTK